MLHEFECFENHFRTRVIRDVVQPVRELDDEGVAADAEKFLLVIRELPDSLDLLFIVCQFLHDACDHRAISPRDHFEGEFRVFERIMENRCTEDLREILAPLECVYDEHDREHMVYIGVTRNFSLLPFVVPVGHGHGHKKQLDVWYHVTLHDCVLLSVVWDVEIH